MNKTFILMFMTGGLIVVAVGVLIFGSFFSTPSVGPEPIGSLGGPFGGSPIVTPGAGGSQSPGAGQTGERMTIALAEGNTEVFDVTKGDNIASTTDGVQYEFSSKSDSEKGYELYYFPQNTSFLVIILREPIGEVRRVATDELIEKLGIDPALVCSIIAEVLVDRDVSDLYFAYSLGFPGCPGSTKLPGD